MAEVWQRKRTSTPTEFSEAVAGCGVASLFFIDHIWAMAGNFVGFIHVQGAKCGSIQAIVMLARHDQRALYDPTMAAS